MRPSWRLPEQIVVVEPGEIELILMELDEPDLVVLRASNGSLYLEATADDDGATVRWLRSPTDRMELRALVRGAVSVHDALRKSKVWLVDRNRERAIVRAWELSGDELTDDVLPEPGGLLPDLTRTALAERPEFAPAKASRLAIEGDPVQGHAIPFTDLAAVTGAAQRLWTALALATAPDTRRRGRDADVSRRSILSAVATPPGSFTIEVLPSDPTVFQASAEAYAKLTAAGSDPENLRRVLGALGGRVALAFSSYLRTIRTHKLNVLAEWATGAAFVSPRIAERASAHVKATEATIAYESFTLQGWFLSFDMVSRPSFKFHELESHDTLEGAVSHAVVDKLARTNESIQVGWGMLYEAKLSVTVVASLASELGSETYELLDCQPVGPLSHFPS